MNVLSVLLKVLIFIEFGFKYVCLSIEVFIIIKDANKRGWELLLGCYNSIFRKLL